MSSYYGGPGVPQDLGTTDTPQFLQLGVGAPAASGVAVDVLGNGGILRLSDVSGSGVNKVSEIRVLPKLGAKIQRMLYSEVGLGEAVSSALSIGGKNGDGEPYWNLRFLTGGSSPEIRMSIDYQGNVIIGTTALATNSTNGFPYIPTCPGTPTGVPTTLTGRAPMVWDSTNDVLYLYDGGWTAVHKPVLTTKGDLLTFGTAPERLPAGADGTVLTAQADGSVAWETPAASLSAVRLTHSADQAATSHAYTTLTWDTESFDTDAYHDAGTPTLITIPAAGTYSAEVIAKSKAAPQGGTAGLQILLNGSTVIASTRAGTPVSAPASLGTITDLEAYWPMEETGGTSLADTSGSGHTGTSSGTTVTSNGLGGYARPGASNTMNMGAVLPATTGFTWATRIYFPGVINTGIMAVTGLSLTRTSAGAISVAGGESNFSTAGSIYWAGVWYHLALSWDQASGALKIYLNGSIVKTHAWTPGYVLSTSGNLTMGGGSYPTYDYVQVFNKALSDAEVLKLATYTSTSPGDNTLTLNSASAPATGTTLSARVPARVFAQGDTLAARWWQDSGSADNIEATAEMPSFTVIRLS